jgi:ankyrin repeat protein
MRRFSVLAMVAAGLASALITTTSFAATPGEQTKADVGTRKRDNADASRLLFEAAIRGDLAEMERQEKRGGDPNARQRGGVTPLINACYTGQPAAVERLIAIGADVNQANDDNEVPILVAATTDKADALVEILLTAGAKADAPDKTGRSPLAVHAMMGRSDAIKRLLKAGAAIDAADDRGATALHVAAARGHAHLMPLLGGEPRLLNRAQKDGQTALMRAALGGKREAVLALSKLGANRQQVDPTTGLNAIGFAIEGGHVPTIKAFLDTGTSADDPVGQKANLLGKAVALDRAEIANFLIAAGARVDAVPQDGMPPLLFATAFKRRSMVKLLLDAKADPNKPAPVTGALPLHLASYLGDLPIVQTLVEHGAEIEKPNPQGGTPLRAAADAGHVDVVRWLLERGAKSKIFDKGLHRPIDYARKNGHAAIVELLQKAER